MTTRMAGLGRATYLVEYYRPGHNAEALRRLVAYLEKTATEPEFQERPVRILESIVVPDDEALLIVFQAASEEAVVEFHQQAGQPMDRIVRSLAHVRREGP